PRTGGGARRHRRSARRGARFRRRRRTRAADRREPARGRGVDGLHARSRRDRRAARGGRWQTEGARMSREAVADHARFAPRWHEHDWQLIREGPQLPVMHMALDETLTYEVGAGRRPPTLRIWEWSSNAVILGRFQSVRNEGDPSGAEKHDMTV